MDVVNGVCTLCTENKLVFSNKDKNIFFDLLKKLFFTKTLVKQFPGFTKNKSICIPCAYNLEIVNKIAQNFKSKTRNKRGCSICSKDNKLAYIISSQHISSIAINFVNDVNENGQIDDLCLHCCYCLLIWHKLRSTIRAMDSGSDTDWSKNNELDTSDGKKETQRTRATVHSESEKDSEVKTGNTMASSSKRRKSFALPNVSNVTTLQKRRYASSSGTETDTTPRVKESTVRATTKRTRLTSEESEGSTKKKYKKNAKIMDKSAAPSVKDTRSRTKANTSSSNTNNFGSAKQLQYLKTVHTEAHLGSVNLSCEVILDKKMMFSIPFVLLESMKEPSTEHIDIIEVSSDDEQVPLERKATHRMGLRKIKGVPRTAKVIKQKKSVKIRTKTIYICLECDETFSSNCSYYLHTLQHESSYSPVVVIESCNLDEAKRKVSEISDDHVEVMDIDENNDIVDVCEEITDSSTFHTASSDSCITDEKEMGATEQTKEEETKIDNISELETNQKIDDEKGNKEENIIKKQDSNSDAVNDEMINNKIEINTAAEGPTAKGNESEDIIDTEAELNKGTSKNEIKTNKNIANEDISAPKAAVKASKKRTNNNENLPVYRPGPKSTLAKRLKKMKQTDDKNDKDASLNENDNKESLINIEKELNDTDAIIETLEESTGEVKMDNKEPDEDIIHNMEEIVVDEQTDKQTEQENNSDCKKYEKNTDDSENKTIESLGENGGMDLNNEDKTATSDDIDKSSENIIDIVDNEVVIDGTDELKHTTNNGTEANEIESVERIEEAKKISEIEDYKIDLIDEDTENDMKENKSEDLNEKNTKEINKTENIEEIELESKENDDSNLVADNCTKDNLDTKEDNSENEIKISQSSLDNVELDGSIVNLNIDDVQQDIIVDDCPKSSETIEEDILLDSIGSPKDDSDVETLIISSLDSDENEKEEEDKSANKDVEGNDDKNSKDTDSECPSKVEDTFTTVETLLENLGA